MAKKISPSGLNLELIAPFLMMRAELPSIEIEPTAETKRTSEQQISSFEACYAHTKNPLFVWRAYLECRRAKLLIPDWVHGYLDSVATEFWQLATSIPKSGLNRQVLKILKFSSKGTGTVFSKFREITENTNSLELAAEVFLKKLAGAPETRGAPETDESDAVYLVAEDCKKRGDPVSQSTIRRAWKKYQKLFEASKQQPARFVHNNTNFAEVISIPIKPHKAPF